MKRKELLFAEDDSASALQLFDQPVKYLTSAIELPSQVPAAAAAFMPSPGYSWDSN